jgi:hypothetical protein
MTWPDVHISPKYRLSDFQGAPSLEEKATIFDDRIKGWFLDIAEKLLESGNDADEFHPHDFAVLAILALYFEMIGQYMSGRSSDGASQKTFCEGIDWVFPRQYREEQRKKLYKSLRCSLYHNGLTRGAVASREHTEPFLFENGLLFINPNSLLEAIKIHFDGYIAKLKTPDESEVRTKFEATYDANPKL